MPLPKQSGGPNRRRMTRQERHELRERELQQRRGEVEVAADTVFAAVDDLLENLHAITIEGSALPPPLYVRAAAAAVRLAAELAAERSDDQRQRVTVAWAALGEAIATIERYHASAGFWEARMQVKRYITFSTGEVIGVRHYGPYIYRRFLDPDGREQIQYFGKKSLPPEAPLVEDMEQTFSTRTIRLRAW